MTGPLGPATAAVAAAVDTVRQTARLPMTLLRTTNIMLTTDDAVIGATPRQVVWTHRKTTLYRYHSDRREHAVPILLVFALINRPDIFDLRPGHSFVEFLLDEGFDVFLLDWGVPGEEDDDLGLADYVCDELHRAIRETARASGQHEVSLIGWCMGATLAAMHTALYPQGPVRNLVVLTMPIDTRGSTYRQWVDRPGFDVDVMVSNGAVPGALIDVANKLLKPVTNHVTTRRKLVESVHTGTVDRLAYQAMAKWVGTNPPFPGTAYREWIVALYRQNALVEGTMLLRGQRVDFSRIRRQAVLVVTADADHIAPRAGTVPFLTMLGSQDVTHFDRTGGHIGLMAGSRARSQIWPDLAEWLAGRSHA
ncbi:MAG TPA: alpha/beta fold hydrolase [Kineosporiaceae bacterium]